jgi:hypothetical protein
MPAFAMIYNNMKSCMERMQSFGKRTVRDGITQQELNARSLQPPLYYPWP